MAATMSAKWPTIGNISPKYLIYIQIYLHWMHAYKLTHVKKSDVDFQLWIEYKYFHENSENAKMASKMVNRTQNVLQKKLIIEFTSVFMLFYHSMQLKCEIPCLNGFVKTVVSCFFVGKHMCVDKIFLFTCPWITIMLIKDYR